MVFHTVDFRLFILAYRRGPMSSLLMMDSRRISTVPSPRIVESEPSWYARGESRSPDPEPYSSSDILDVSLFYYEVH